MKKKTSLKSALKKTSKKKTRRKEPLWKGPEVDGITQSMISSFLECRERFRLRNIVGLQEVNKFNHRIEYGQMWHLCEESFAAGDIWLVTTQELLREYTKTLCKKYVVAQEQISHWYQVCKTQFPIYVKYWEKHKDTKQRTPLLQEETFKVPYELPSGRVVLLRGKWDSVDLIGKGKNAGVYLQENKTKGDIKEEQQKRQLGFDLQTMFYLVALQEECVGGADLGGCGPTHPEHISGVRYNVVRRPLSGGVGSIRQGKPTKKNPEGESAKDFYSRLGVIISEEPSHFFMRWRVEVTPDDMERFRREFLDSILEHVCDWWECICSARDNGREIWEEASGLHWRTPYGCWNSLASGYTTELDEYLATGSTLGLWYADKLFTELE